MKLSAMDKWVLIGDSITDSGRAQPVGEGLFGALGTGYVNQVSAFLGVWYPELQVRVINMGNGGNTVRDLKSRWQRDVIDMKPDWLSIMIGVNDVWRQFDCPFQKEIHVYIDEYEATLDELVAQTKPIVKGIVLLTPFFMELNREDPMRRQVDLYGDAMKRVAKKQDVMLVDIQADFDKLLKNYYPAYLGWDRVHPNVIGHTLIARSLLSGLGASW